MGRYYPVFYYGDRRSFFEWVTCYLRVRRIEKGFGKKKSGRILDVGCGKARMLEMLKGKGWHVQGTEIGVRPVHEGKNSQGIDIHYGSLEEGQFSNGTFDVVTLWHVLEHLPNPRTTLREIRRILKADGLLILSVPNYGSLQAKLAGPHWFHLDVPRHLFHFKPENLVDLLEQEGFQVGKMNRFSFEYDTFGFVQSILNLLSSRQNLLFDFLNHQWSFRRILNADIDGGLGQTGLPINRKKFFIGSSLMFLLSVPLFLISLVFCPLDGILGYGGTIEVVARKSPK
jgi:2-polyprenyl-3-methyl-5-hydroxy-6-metoxy-1,4-benzoquinol methylase